MDGELKPLIVGFIAVSALFFFLMAVDACKEIKRINLEQEQGFVIQGD